MRFKAIILITIVGYLLIPMGFTLSYQQSDSNSFEFQQVDLTQLTEPNENGSSPFVSTALEIESGDVGEIFFGMQDELFIEGYNFSLYLASRINKFTNETLSQLFTYSLLRQNITKNVVEQIQFTTVEDPVYGRLDGNYTIIFLVNSTNRGLLNSTSDFEVIIKPGANVDVIFTLSDRTTAINEPMESKIGQSNFLSIVLTNTGQNNAFNLSIEIAGINEPVGLANASIPANIPLLASDEKVRLNFTITPQKFGIGELQIEVRFSDGIGSDKTTSYVLTIHTFPNIVTNIQHANISPEVEVEPGVGFNVIVSVQYLDAFQLNPISISLRLTSDSVSFTPPEFGFIPSRNLYEFRGNPLELGIIQMVLSISIFDKVGSDSFTYPSSSLSVDLVVAGSTDPDSSFSDIFPILVIFIYFILLIAFGILYYRQDIRTKFFTRVFGLQILENLNFKTTSIVIDGSNIAWEQTNSENKPRLNNIIRAYKLLKENGFSKIVIIADAALRYQIDEKDELDRLVKSKFIKLVPAKVNADGFILRFSAGNGYLILSNDLYKEYRETYTWIDERRVPYSIMDDSIYLHPTFK